MALSVPPKTDAPTVTCTIDGVEVTVPSGTTIYTAAKEAGIEIPVLCHDERYDPVGVCRMCVVDVGGRVLAAACVRPCEDGMEVTTASAKVEKQRAVLTELLMADQPDEDPKETTTGDNLLLELARRYDDRPRRAACRRRAGAALDDSNPVISVNHDACILCDRCVRACDDIQGNDVIGRTGKGYETRIAFDLNDPMGESTCVTCGECVAACPTGALVNKPIHDVPIRPRERAQVGRHGLPVLRRRLRADLPRRRPSAARSPSPTGREQPGNQSRLCVKGRYGWDYAASKQRLTTPLIRVTLPEGARSPATSRAKAAGASGPAASSTTTRSCRTSARRRWEEALDLAASRLKEIHDRDGSGAIAGFGSAKCSNEEAYLFQKLIRAGFGTNNVDHCTRLCHASSVAALLEGVGSGAVSTTYGDIINADVAILAGTNTTANHPVASSFFKQARRRGTKLIVVDPRRERVADHADIFCQIKPGTDVAFYNGVLHEVIRLGLVDREFIARARDQLRRAGQAGQASTRRSARRRSAASTPPRSARSRGSGARPAPASSTGAWGSPSTRRAPTTRAA